jgi:hypothetical protein
MRSNRKKNPYALNISKSHKPQSNKKQKLKREIQRIFLLVSEKYSFPQKKMKNKNKKHILRVKKGKNSLENCQTQMYIESKDKNREK